MINLTNVNTAEPGDVAMELIRAMQAAGYDGRALDLAAMAMLRGAAHA